MKRWFICALVAICSCSTNEPPLFLPVVAIEPKPVVTGEIDISFGPVRRTVAPPGSAAAGSKWLTYDVSFANASDHSLWIAGYSASNPFVTVEVRRHDDMPWRRYGYYYCGTGAGTFEIGTRAIYHLSVDLPETLRGQQYRVLIPYGRDQENADEILSASDVHSLDGPG
jgi:hypothetical protein